jgi:hypothetical protein
MSRKRIRMELVSFEKSSKRKIVVVGGLLSGGAIINNDRAMSYAEREIADPHMYIAIHSAGDRGFTDTLGRWRASSSPQRLVHPITRPYDNRRE